MKQTHEEWVQNRVMGDEMKRKRDLLSEYLRKDGDKRHSFMRIMKDFNGKLSIDDIIDLICLYPKEFKLVMVKSEGKVLRGVGRVISH